MPKEVVNGVCKCEGMKMLMVMVVHRMRICDLVDTFNYGKRLINLGTPLASGLSISDNNKPA